MDITDIQFDKTQNERVNQKNKMEELKKNIRETDYLTKKYCKENKIINENLQNERHFQEIKITESEEIQSNLKIFKIVNLRNLTYKF